MKRSTRQLELDYLEIALDQELGGAPPDVRSAVLGASGADRRRAAAAAERAAVERPRPARPWSQAALILLGLGVVIALAVTTGERPTSARPQDKPPKPIELEDAAEFLELLEAVETIDVQLRKVRVVSAASARFEVVPGAELALRGEADVAAWTDALRDTVAEGASKRYSRIAETLWLDLGLRDGRSMRVLVPSEPEIRIVFLSEGAYPAREALDRLARAAFNETRLAGRRARGEALTESELLALPAECETVVASELAPAEYGLLERFPRLRHLTIDDARHDVGDAAIETLVTIAGLESLEIPANAISDRGLESLAELPKLRALTLRGGGTKLTGTGFAAIPNRLRALTLDSCGAISAAGWRALSRQSRLIELTVIRPGASVAGLPHAVRSLANLETLTLRESELTDELVEAWPWIELHTLRLERCGRIEAEWIRAINRVEPLRRLSLSGSTLDDDAVAAIADGRFEYLDLTRTGVTDEAVRQLREALPGCEIERYNY